MKVINIALRREDGKVESDTVYSDKILTEEDVKGIGERFNCDVIVSHVGEITFFDDETIKENSMTYNRPKTEEPEKKEDTVNETTRGETWNTAAEASN